MTFSKKIQDLKNTVLKESIPLFAQIDAAAEANTLKVLDAMRDCRVSDAHFNTTSGYAYDDIGRSKLEELYAKVFGAERALVRTQFVSVSCAQGMSSFPSRVRHMTLCRPSSATQIPARVP